MLRGRQYPLHREQGEIQVVELEQDAVQLGLVAHRAAERGFAIRLVSDLQGRKPLGQRVVHMTLDSDLVADGHFRHAHSIAVNQGVRRLSKG